MKICVDLRRSAYQLYIACVYLQHVSRSVGLKAREGEVALLTFPLKLRGIIGNLDGITDAFIASREAVLLLLNVIAARDER
jgi:hypothetical protein